MTDNSYTPASIIGTTPRTNSAPPNAFCPRCHYDLAGETARWSDAWPLDGQCPECGLGFEWADILAPDRRICIGLVEHATGLRRRFRWTFTTMRLAVLPWVLWRKLRLHHEMRPGAIIAGLLTALFFVYLCNAAAEAIWLVIEIASSRATASLMGRGAPPAPANELLLYINPFTAPIGRFESYSSWNPVMPVVGFVPAPTIVAHLAVT